jgi:hypothetical protein
VRVNHNGSGPRGLAATVAVARSIISYLPQLHLLWLRFKDVGIADVRIEVPWFAGLMR